MKDSRHVSKQGHSGSFAEIVRNDFSEAIKNEREQAEKHQRVPDEKAAKALKELVSEEDGERANVSLRTILGGDILAGPWFRRQFWYIVMLIAMSIFYVSNRYYCQREMIVGTRLADTLLDRRYKALTLSSQLKEMTRRSAVEKHLNDTALKTSMEPLYLLAVDKNDTLGTDYE